jgi:hypothetical protein
LEKTIEQIKKEALKEIEAASDSESRKGKPNKKNP